MEQVKNIPAERDITALFARSELANEIW